ncbi:MAG: alanine racemase [Candidatus Aminicenantes bacterium]|nr:alanine racemase [Candidatus Aminicenantes bacterium]MBL7083803.1 alanine racemase [Candidatus Aminicenantes bacterium]
MVPKLLKWVEIDSSALSHNIHQFRKLIGENRKLLVMVKANAYGHGMMEVSDIALRAGADWLGVDSLEEGLFLRKKGFNCPILTVGYIPFEGLKEAVTNDLRITVYNLEAVSQLATICRQLNKKALLHVKVETGTFRQGVSGEEVLSFIHKIQEFPELVLEGLSSHFANIEDTTDHSYAQFQLKNFNNIFHELKKNNIKIPIKHISCSASAILFPETYFDMVRAGIGIYGLWPSKETYLSCLLQKRKPLLLKPVLSWKTRIAQIKKVPKASFIGYGCTYKTTRATVLAVLPVGYYDGYSRGLSNSSYVLIRGQRAPIRGRVAMDFIMADITDIPGINLEDEVILIGSDGEEAITADDLALLVETINYEIVSRINPLISRIIV